MQTSNRHIAIICNEKAGKGKPKKLLPTVTNFITNQEFSFQVFTSQLPQTLAQFSDIIIMGGDGTIHFVINHFREIQIPISIIPCGTGNDFANLLWGKTKLDFIISNALFAKPKHIDAGKCNETLFINGVGIGFDGWVVKKMLAKNLFTGIAAYYSTVIPLLFFYKESLVTIRTIENEKTQTLFMLSIANGKSYGGGFKVAPFASVNDGLLESILVKKISLFNRFKYLPVIEKGNHLHKSLPFIEYTQLSEITIQSEKPLQAHLDGEYFTNTSFTIVLLPNKFLFRF